MKHQSDEPNQKLKLRLAAEEQRLAESRARTKHWKRWGPYLSERAWGTVREDYSPHGSAWDYFPHDHARSKAYRWGEDGLGGISDRQQNICFALALWNGRDPILKERLFGLTGSQGNHGEDVKEYYFYLDSTPTHSYMKFLYKYPQSEYPYQQLAAENQRRGKRDLEFELLDTGIFNDNRYFDVFAEYAKADAEDILINITIANRGPETARLDLLPTIWFRNTWSWDGQANKPQLKQTESVGGASALELNHSYYSTPRWLFCDGSPELLFTENETNKQRLFDAQNESQFVKDGINNFIVHGQAEAINPAKVGTKAAAHYQLTLAPGESQTIKLRLTDNGSHAKPFGKEFDKVFAERIQEADEFYNRLAPAEISEDAKNVQRQAFAARERERRDQDEEADDQRQPPHPSGPLARPDISRIRRRRTVAASHYFGSGGDEPGAAPGGGAEKSTVGADCAVAVAWNSCIGLEDEYMVFAQKTCGKVRSVVLKSRTASL